MGKLKEDIILYDINDIKRIFRCGNNKAYQLMNAHCFPSIKIGGKSLVEKSALEKWIVKNQGKPILL